MTETRIFLIRHGEADGLRPGAFLGQLDLPLSAAGIDRMTGVAESLSRLAIAKVYASTLARCVQSAEIVGKQFGLTAILHDGLKEVALGDWEGLTFEEIASKFPEDAERMRREPIRFVYPGGESIERMAARATKAWEEILFRSEGQEVAVIAHGGVNRAILAGALDMPLPSMFKLHQDHGCINVIEVANRFPMVRLFNASPGLL